MSAKIGVDIDKPFSLIPSATSTQMPQ